VRVLDASPKLRGLAVVDWGDELGIVAGDELIM
jgi:hypothetical protein